MIPEYQKIRPILLIGQHDAPPVKGKRGLDPEARKKRGNAGGDGDYGGPEDGGGDGGGGGENPMSLRVYGDLEVLALSATRPFAALVRITQDQRVTWTCTVGTISPNGVYTAPAAMPEDPLVHVRAVSVLYPDLFDEVVFPLSETLRHLTLVLHNECGPVSATGTWSVATPDSSTSIALTPVAAGQVGSQVTSQLFDTAQVNQVKAHVTFSGALYNGASSAIATAVQTDETTWVADLCDPEPVWTYFNTQQTYTAYCQDGLSGPSVTVTRNAGTFSSTESVAAANALALADAQEAAEALLVCRPLVLDLSADALNARGGIVLVTGVDDWNGEADWVLTIGAVRRSNGMGGYLDPGNFIKDTEFGSAYLAELMEFHTETPSPLQPVGFLANGRTFLRKEFYFSTIDPRWLIGNSDGDTWLIDVTVQVTLTDADPELVLTQTWKKYLLI